MAWNPAQAKRGKQLMEDFIYHSRESVLALLRTFGSVPTV